MSTSKLSGELEKCCVVALNGLTSRLGGGGRNALSRMMLLKSG